MKLMSMSSNMTILSLTPYKAELYRLAPQNYCWPQRGVCSSAFHHPIVWHTHLFIIHIAAVTLTQTNCPLYLYVWQISIQFTSVVGHMCVCLEYKHTCAYTYQQPSSTVHDGCRHISDSVSVMGWMLSLTFALLSILAYLVTWEFKP